MIGSGFLDKLFHLASPEKDRENIWRLRSFLMVEASMKKKTQPVSRAIHDIIVARLGDNGIHSTLFASQSAKIDPVLRLFPCSLFMCTTNDDLDKGRGNDTVCKCVQVKLKSPDSLQWKNWEGRKGQNCFSWWYWVDQIRTLSQPTATTGNTKVFQTEAQDFLVFCPISNKPWLWWPHSLSSECLLVMQFPVNSTVATTGHKLQGMSKDKLIVSFWNYRFAHWIYVILSRVQTLSGLYLCKPLDLHKEFKVQEKLLIQFKQRMKEKESQFLNKRTRSNLGRN